MINKKIEFFIHNRQDIPALMSEGYILRVNKLHFSTIIFRPYSKVNPVAPLLIPLDEELIEIPLGAISDI